MVNDNFPDGTPAYFRGEDDDIDDVFEYNSGACFEANCKTCGPQVRRVETALRARIVAAIRKRGKADEKGGDPQGHDEAMRWADWIERGCPDGE